MTLAEAVSEELRRYLIEINKAVDFKRLSNTVWVGFAVAERKALHKAHIHFKAMQRLEHHHHV